MSRWLPVVIVAALWGATGAPGTPDVPGAPGVQEHGQDQEREPPRTARQRLMRGKLEHLDRILEGVLMGRHQQVADHAQKITLLTQQEDWQVIQTEEYHERSTEFRRTSNLLAEQARKKLWDAETLTYLALTQQCIQCHRAIRGEEEGGAPR